MHNDSDFQTFFQKPCVIANIFNTKLNLLVSLVVHEGKESAVTVKVLHFLILNILKIERFGGLKVLFVDFAGFNVFASTWAIFSYIGIKNLFVDIWLGLTDMLYVDVPLNKRSQKKGESEYEFDWKDILYHGEISGMVTHKHAEEIALREK